LAMFRTHGASLVPSFRSFQIHDSKELPGLASATFLIFNRIIGTGCIVWRDMSLDLTRMIGFLRPRAQFDFPREASGSLCSWVR
jgi:hypothetical protein